MAAAGAAGRAQRGVGGRRRVGRAARTFALAGDQVWLDAQIVRWHPAANLVGLHTAYRLERIGGRYRTLDDERTAPRTVAALRPDRPVPRSVRVDP
ncbi:MAG: hypothetical protein U5K81_12225 [Trueperaceae bacterium]|nr:hypothetical protein [Trueperaceae bacterium]